MITFRGMFEPGCPAPKLASDEPTRGLRGTQHGLCTSSGWRRREPVRGPLPGVSRHVEEAVAVGRVRADGRGALVAVELQVLPGELALPGVRQRSPFRELGVSPGEDGAVEPAASRVFPLGFRGKLLARPGRVRLRVFVGDLDDRMVIAAVDRRAGAARSLPRGPGDVRPPVSEVVQVHRPAGLAEHERARYEELGVGVGVVVGIERSLGHRDVARVADEAPEVGSGHGMLVHPETVDRDAVHRPLLRVELGRPHGELAAVDPLHARWSRIGGRARHAVTLYRFDRYCRVIAILRRSSGVMRWSLSSAASSTSIWTQSTVPVKRLSSGV